MSAALAATHDLAKLSSISFGGADALSHEADRLFSALVAEISAMVQVPQGLSLQASEQQHDGGRANIDIAAAAERGGFGRA